MTGGTFRVAWYNMIHERGTFFAHAVKFSFRVWSMTFSYVVFLLDVIFVWYIASPLCCRWKPGHCVAGLLSPPHLLVLLVPLPFLPAISPSPPAIDSISLSNLLFILSAIAQADHGLL